VSEPLSFQVRRFCRAPRAVVFDTLQDVPNWSAWAPGVRSSRWEPAPGAPSGEQAIRSLTFPMGRVVREQIVEAVPPRGHRYVLLGWTPVRDYQGEVALEEEADGCVVNWRGRFDAAVPGSGVVMRALLRIPIERMAGALVTESERRWQDHLSKPGNR
jgi:Polyketide cyclase / dehydrase and lipid transport